MTDDSPLEARLTDQDYFRPPTEFVGQANVTDPAIYDRFGENYPEAFEEYAELLDWDEHWDEVLDDSNPPFYEWFTDGTLNASANCLDRHLEERGEEAAIEWVGEPVDEANRTYTYAAANSFTSRCSSA